MGQRGLPTEAKTWKGVAPQGWNSDLNREGVTAIHWMPEKFSAFPRTRVCLHLANRNPPPPYLPAKGDVELRLAGRKLVNGITHKTSHASYFPDHHPVGVMPPMRWNAGMFRGKSRSPRSLQTLLWQRAELRQPRGSPVKTGCWLCQKQQTAIVGPFKSAWRKTHRPHQ